MHVVLHTFAPYTHDDPLPETRLPVAHVQWNLDMLEPVILSYGYCVLWMEIACIGVVL